MFIKENLTVREQVNFLTTIAFDEHKEQILADCEEDVTEWLPFLGWAALQMNAIDESFFDTAA